MNPTAQQYTSAHRHLTAVLDAVPAQGWTAPSPCENWSARDVLTHMIETQREFLTGHGIDLGDAPQVDADPAAAWRDHAERVVEAVSDESVASTAYDGHFGPTTVGETLVQFYVWDMLVHRWDIARSAGADTRFSDTELDQIERGADGFGEALYMDGVCRRPVDAPSDADREVRVLARLGRAA